ncbi:hypothetical protein B0I37DRAFT_354567 [Chaetomium sp. MPI-CAGE-AT-0009]|nr:hypothetical protein B0I37DRAFT_354567 [Chaetomium sp. MPI-CAGE-AT-0009]
MPPRLMWGYFSRAEPRRRVAVLQSNTPMEVTPTTYDEHEPLIAPSGLDKLEPSMEDAWLVSMFLRAVLQGLPQQNEKRKFGGIRLKKRPESARTARIASNKGSQDETLRQKGTGLLSQAATCGGSVKSSSSSPRPVFGPLFAMRSQYVQPASTPATGRKPDLSQVVPNYEVVVQYGPERGDLTLVIVSKQQDRLALVRPIVLANALPVGGLGVTKAAPASVMLPRLGDDNVLVFSWLPRTCPKGTWRWDSSSKALIGARRAAFSECIPWMTAVIFGYRFTHVNH